MPLEPLVSCATSCISRPLRIHYASITHALHIHYMSIMRPLCIHYTSITHASHIHYASITHPLHVHYASITRLLCIDYTSIAHPLHVHYASIRGQSSATHPNYVLGYLDRAGVTQPPGSGYMFLGALLVRSPPQVWVSELMVFWSDQHKTPMQIAC